MKQAGGVGGRREGDGGGAKYSSYRRAHKRTPHTMTVRTATSAAGSVSLDHNQYFFCAVPQRKAQGVQIKHTNKHRGDITARLSQNEYHDFSFLEIFFVLSMSRLRLN